MQIAKTKFLRLLTGCTWKNRKRNSDIREELNTSRVNEKIETYCQSWYDNIRRMHHQKLSTYIWNIEEVVENPSSDPEIYPKIKSATMINNKKISKIIVKHGRFNTWMREMTKKTKRIPSTANFFQVNIYFQKKHSGQYHLAFSEDVRIYFFWHF